MTPADLIACYRIPALFHFTDKANLESIRAHRGLYSLERLKHYGISVARPGGNQWSWDADAYKGLDRYVHLSFAKEHPMKYVAEQEGRIGPVHIVMVDPDVLTWPGVMYTLDVSNKAGVEILQFDEAVERLDLEVLYELTNWRDHHIQERLKIARRAEVLVPDHIPIEQLRNL